MSLITKKSDIRDSGNPNNQGAYLSEDLKKDSEIRRKNLWITLTKPVCHGSHTAIYKTAELEKIYCRKNLCLKLFKKTKTRWGLLQSEGNSSIDEAVKINNLLALEGYAPRVYDIVKVGDKTALVCDFIEGGFSINQFTDERFTFNEAQKKEKVNWVNGKYVDLQGAQFKDYQAYRQSVIDEAIKVTAWPVGSNKLYQTIPGVQGQRDTLERLQKFGIDKFTGNSLLDVGCSTGMFCRKASDDGVMRVFGIEKPSMVKTIQKLSILEGYYNIDFLGLDLLLSTWEDIKLLTNIEKFDTILFLAMEAHVGKPAWLTNCKTLVY